MRSPLPITLPSVRPVLMAVLLTLGAQSTSAWADERADLEQLRGTTLNLIKALVDAGLLTPEKAEQLLKQSEQARQAPEVTPAAPAPQAAASAPRPGVIRVPYVSETVKNEMREDIKREVLQQARTERWGDAGALPAWARRINIEGDVRVRLQGEDWDRYNFGADEAFSYAEQSNSPAWSPDLTNTNNGRARMTLRARLGLSSDLAFGFKSGLRLSTGSAGAVSTSQTLGGGDGQLSKYSLFVDRAWVQWTAYRPQVTVYAGRFANPYVGSDLIWPDDINFDGLATSARYTFNDANEVFASAGAFPLQEFQSTADDKWLYGLQVGGNFRPSVNSQFVMGLGYFDFSGIEGHYDSTYSDQVPVGTSYLSSEYRKAVRQKGNTLIRINQGTTSTLTAVSPVWGLASRFKPLTLSTALSYTGWDALNVRGSFDLIKNTGFDLADMRRRANRSDLDVAEKTLALQARVQIGSAKQELLGDWSAFVAWRRFERDAWVDAFTDTTWHMGGTNYSGWSLGGQYYVGPRTALGLRLTSTRSLKDGRQDVISGLAVDNLSSTNLKVDVLQLELNSRF